MKMLVEKEGKKWSFTLSHDDDGSLIDYASGFKTRRSAFAAAQNAQDRIFIRKAQAKGYEYQTEQDGDDFYFTIIRNGEPVDMGETAFMNEAAAATAGLDRLRQIMEYGN